MPRIEITEAEAREFRETAKRSMTLCDSVIIGESGRITRGMLERERPRLIALVDLFDAALAQPSIARQRRVWAKAILDRLVANLEETEALRQERDELLAEYWRCGSCTGVESAPYVQMLEGDDGRVA